VDPFFGWSMARLDMIHIDRSRRTEAWNKVAEQGRAHGPGNWVIMFPEGTRIPRGERGTYKTGASRLAIATGVPIVPIAVTRRAAGRAAASCCARVVDDLHRPSSPKAARPTS
jgi:1-acyl-sn-glycerol-3-phosphate acyltransferase